MQTLSRREIIEKSLTDFGGIIVCESTDQAVELANEIAPEHLEVMLENPFEYLGRLDNAGSIFLGKYAPEPLGDYYAGPNHVLPTSGTARFFSPLSVDAFVKKSSFIYYTEEALREAKEDIVRFANPGGAHRSRQLDSGAVSQRGGMKHGLSALRKDAGNWSLTIPLRGNTGSGWTQTRVISFPMKR